MNKKLLLTLLIIIIVSIISILIIRNYQKNNISYQMIKLKNGTIEEKMFATDFMTAKKFKDAIPLIIDNIDSQEFAYYQSKAPETLSCFSTFSLEKITDLNFGNTCNMDNSKTNEQIQQIKQAWKDWYENEYNK